jgi:hypothetical protein
MIATYLVPYFLGLIAGYALCYLFKFKVTNVKSTDQLLQHLVNEISDKYQVKSRSARITLIEMEYTLEAPLRKVNLSITI